MVTDPILAPVNTSPSTSEGTAQSDEESQVEEQALSAFLYDYCVTSANNLLSRGYLDGLESLLAHAGPNSELALASKVVAFASQGKKLGRPSLLHKASVLYSSLLCSFRLTIANPTTSNTVESLMTAVLLGLYEVYLETRVYGTLNQN